MKFAKFAAATAALSLAVSPALARSAPERGTAPAASEDEIGGQAGIFVLLILAAVIIGFIATDDDGPVSP